MVIIEWSLWESKDETINYITEMEKIGLICRINHIGEAEWNEISARFGEFVERGAL